MESSIQLEVLGLSSSQSQSGSFALVLGETEGKRRLPIIIGMAEAQAIAIEIENIKPNRPFTHDLFKTFADSFGVDLQKIIISNIKEGVFYASMICSDGSKTIEIDARPSDAIALGLRFDVPIFTTEAILDEAGIILTDEEEELSNTDAQNEEEEFIEDLSADDKEQMPFEDVFSGKDQSLGDYSDQQLEIMLEDALNSEDYEKAASIRDELNRRSK